jgi:hypothetical protein
MLQVEYDPEIVETPFLPNYGIPNQQYWGIQPQPISAPNINDIPVNTDTSNIDNSNVAEIQNTSNDIGLQDTATTDETLSAFGQLATILPTEEINPNLHDNNDLEILLWNKHINL